MAIRLKLKQGISTAQSALVNAVAAVATGQVLARTATGVEGAGATVTAANLQALVAGEETELHSHPHPIFVGTEENPDPAVLGIPVGGIYVQHE